MIYGNYRCNTGRILVRSQGQSIDVASASARQIIALRRDTLGYVSQFLRAIPRVATRDLVSGAAQARGADVDNAQRHAAILLERLNIPSRLWGLAPATFSGGEQQRVNIARGFAADRPIMLLDEPTASLDAQNRAVVEEIILEKKRAGAAIIAILHDEDARKRVADDIFKLRAAV